LKHLPKNSDLELCILKCHLLIEELLEKIITNASKNPNHVVKAKLSFSQKIHIARAFSSLKKEAWLWGSIKKLNDTRNELAHELSAQKKNEMCEKFISIVEGEFTKPEQKILSEKFGRFQWAAYAVYIKLSVHAQYNPMDLKNSSLLTKASNNRWRIDALKAARVSTPALYACINLKEKYLWKIL
jgi:hypothetical protein